MKPNLGDVIADKYRLDRVLGEGGMSTVFAAVNVVTGKAVAIKWLQAEMLRDEEQSQRLLREAQATSSIDHPNVVNVFDLGRHEGALFLVMELLHGEPLSHLLMRGPQDPFQFVRLMLPVMRGVHAAHRMGVVHRDLKPDNIFLCQDPHGELREPKVLDFGISKLANDALTPGQELTREGTVFGTPQYMAPEQMRDARAADVRSDVYALGVIFYRAFSDEYPYDADTLTALAIRIVEGNAAPLHELCPQLDRELSEVIMRALSLDPEARFESVAAFGQALEPYADGLLFAPGLERESLTPRRASSPSLERLSPLPSLRRISPPPPPPRTGSLRNNPAELTTALKPSDLLIEAQPTTLRRESKLTIPPPPIPTLSQPSRALEIVPEDSYATHRAERGAHKQSWVLSATLVAIGLLAPAGWQQWQRARGAAALAPSRPSQGLAIGKTAHVYAAQALRPEGSYGGRLRVMDTGGEHARDTKAALALPAAAAQDKQDQVEASGESTVGARGTAAESRSEALAQRAPRAAAAELPRGALPPTPAPSKEELDKQRKRRPSAALVVPAQNGLAPRVESLTLTAEDKRAEPAALQSERNPYLRR